MARSLRIRLNSSGNGKPMLDLLNTGAHWEKLRAHYYSQAGLRQQASDCLSRQAIYEREAEAAWREAA